MSTLLLPVAAMGLLAWAFVYANHLMGTTENEPVKIALAIVGSGWASIAFGLMAWTPHLPRYSAG